MTPSDPDAAGTGDGGDCDLPRQLEFSLLYAGHYPRVVAFLRVQGAPLDLASDLAQEAMIQLYRDWCSVDHPKAWVRRVAVRLWWRSRNAAASEVMAEKLFVAESRLISEEAIENMEGRHDFLRLIDALSDQQRQVMAWTFDGFTPQEIADELGLNPATVRSNLRHARRTLGDRGRP